VTRTTASWAAPPRRTSLALAFGPVDAHPVLAPIALVGLLTGAALALFGLPPVHLHGPFHHAGLMDPLCGMTRAVRSTMRGDLSGAWSYNPAGILLVLGAAVALVRSAVGVVTGRWLNVSSWPPARRVAAATAVAVGLLWLNQQLHAALLMS
jgi:hypothetical protein